MARNRAEMEKMWKKYGDDIEDAIATSVNICLYIGTCSKSLKN